ncbi:MAG: hypothetical protein ACYDIA_11470 [Candidatus Humimicrobiaceae bacterium]
MFLLIKPLGKYKYIHIVHNYRVGKKIKHKPIMHLGYYDKERFSFLKKELKDFKPMSRAATIIREIEDDVANVKKHASPFTKKINYNRK